MKKLFSIFLSFLLLFCQFSPRASAIEIDELDGDDLAKYFIFEVGTWWEYVNTIEYSGASDITEDDLAETEEEASFRVDAIPCQVYQCFARGDQYLTYSYYVEEGKIYLYEISDRDTNHILSFSLDGFSGEVDPWIGLLWGYSSLSSYETHMACDPNFDSDYEYAGVSGGLLQQTCSLSFTNTDGEIRYVTTDSYVENLGWAQRKTKKYVDSVWQYTVTTFLKDSSIQWDADEAPEVQTAEETSDDTGADDAISNDEVPADENGVEELEDEEESIFSDLDTNHPNYLAIDYLYDASIIGGYEDGTFRPNNTVNRAELLKILVEGQGITPDENAYKDCFPDVTSAWYAKYVCYAKEEGWVSGYPDDTFRPANPVNKVEALKMLLNSQNIDLEEVSEAPFADVSVEDWFAPYVAMAQELGLLEEDGFYFTPDEERTRTGICEELYRLLTR